MKRTPFHCFRKPAPEAAADDRNFNIKETTENETDKADSLLSYTLQKKRPMLS